MFNKPLILALMFFIGISGLFGYASYYFYGEKQLLKERLVVSEANAKLLSNSLLKAEKAYKIADKIASEYQLYSKDIKDSEANSLTKIDIIVAAKKAPTAAVEAANNEVNINGKLPADIVSLLSEACIHAKGDSCNDT